MIMQVHNDINTANIQCVEADTSDTSDTSDASDAFDGVYFRGAFGNIPGDYRMNPHEIRRLKFRRQHISQKFEQEQWDKFIVYGADGSIIENGDDVYMLEGRFQDRVKNIDYFHGIDSFGVPEAQLNCFDSHGVRYEEYGLAMNMVQMDWGGKCVHCLIVLQRKWRNRRWRLCVQPGLIQLAKDMLKPICKTSRSLRHTFKHRQQLPAKQQNSRSGVLVIDSNGVVR